MTLSPEEIHAKAKAAFGEAIGELQPPAKDAFFTVTPAKIREVCAFLKEDPSLAFDFLEDVTATDHHPKEPLIRLVYHLFSYRHRHGIVVKAELPRDGASLPSLDPVWKAANWLEREVYDLFGVAFEGHPDLRRIMMPDDWVGHPLRKDYQEAGGYFDITNVRDSALVEFRRMDEAVRAAAEKSAATNATPATPATAPAAPAPAGGAQVH